MNDTSTVIVAGAMRLATIKAKRLWYHVDFGIGVEVKVNPKAYFQGANVRFNPRLIALKAAECIESLPLKSLEPVFSHIAGEGGGSTEEKRWIAKKLSKK